MVGLSYLSAAVTALVAAACVAAQDPHYKVPFADGSGEWAAAFKKAKAMVATLSLEEKLNITIVDGGIARIGFGGSFWTDGPNGAARVPGHSAVPAALHAAATFDRKLVYDRARIMGAEAYDLGYQTLTGPMLNIARAPEAGRNYEGFGPDPYLMSEYAVSTVKGIQGQNVSAMAKHFALNNQEHGRSFSSSDVDDRAFREIYLPGFEHAVKAGVGSVMCAYNAVNGTYLCENDLLIGTVLKGELNFQGYVITDDPAAHTTAPLFNAGTDQIMGTISHREAGKYNSGHSDDPGLGEALRPFIANGSVSLARLDDAATRILSTAYRFGWDDASRPTLTDSTRDAQRDHKVKIRQIAAAGTVLLKNKNHALPLKKPFALAVIGLDAGADPSGVTTVPGQFVNSFPGNFTLFGGGASAAGTVAMGWGSGWVSFPYLVTPVDALTARARQDNTWLQPVTDNYNIDLIDFLAKLPYNDACLVFVNSNSGEEAIVVDGNYGDRNNLTAWSRGDELVEQVAGSCANTIVVVHSPGPILMPWSDHENISAIVWGGLPGQESGNALVDVLYGDVNPSGRLPYTIAKQQADYSATVDYTPEIYQGSLYHINYTESYYVDYRHFQAKEIEPLYAFGFGLSYTEFAYSGLKVNAASKRYRRTAKKTASSAAATPYPEELYDTLYTVSATVKNTGKLDGHEVSQLYVRLSAEADAPFKQLKGFERTWLKAGKSATVTFELRKRDVVYWSVEKQQWVVPESVEVYVGASSDDLRLSKKITL